MIQFIFKFIIFPTLIFIFSINHLFRLVFTLFKQLNWLFVGLHSHIRMFYMTLDPIENVESLNEPASIYLHTDTTGWLARARNNVHYVFPFLMMVTINLDSVAVLAQDDFRYNVTGHPTLLTHRIYPAALYLEGDVVCNLGNAVEMFVYGFLLFTPPLDPHHRMYSVFDSRKNEWKIISNGKIWDAENTKKILAYREKARRVIRFIVACALVQVGTYWMASLMMKPTKTTKDYVIFLFLPLFSLYSNFGVVYMPFNFVRCAHYIRIKQQLLVGNIQKFTNDMIHESDLDLENVDLLKVEMYWRKFASINHEILALFDELHAYNRFWSKYVTSYFVGYIGMMGYLVYGFLFAETEFNCVKTSFFAFFNVEMLTIMLVISYECSCIVYCNVQIYKTNRMFCYAFGKIAQTRHVYLLKMDKMIANYKGTRNGFRLINNLIIDSRMFEILFFYITTLFMTVFSNKTKVEQL